MKIARSFILSVFVGVLFFAATPAVGVPPPPPPGVHLMPGMVWCPRCGGHGRVPSGFLGWNDKRCPECKGLRMLRVRPLPPPPPPPPVAHHHHPAPVHHAKPVPPPRHPAPVKVVPPPPAHRR